MSVMSFTNKSSRFGLVGLLVLAVTGCMSTPTVGGRMQPLPGAVGVSGTEEKKDHGYGGDDGEDGWLMDRLLGKKPATETAPPYQNANSSGVQQVAAIGPATEDGQPHQASAIPTNEVDGLVGESLVEPKKWWDLSRFSPTEISDSIKGTFGLDPNEERAQVIYKEGVALYKSKHYSAAAARFKKAASRWPDSILEEDALFYQAESHFFADEYPEAQDAFGNLLKKHGNTRYLDTVSKRLFAIGQYWEKAYAAEPHWPVTPNMTDDSRPLFDTWGNGIKAYEMIAMNDPTGPLADDSLMSLANAYFRRNRYQDAADYYDRIRTDYPKSQYLLDSHMLAMKSYEMSYQGPQYDGTPLKKASKIADTLLTQFGPKLGQERENILQAKSRIIAKIAEQDWEMAKFYEGKGQYRSARFYYHQIMKDYPGTPIAKSSQERLVALKDKPVKEVNKFQSVINLLDPEDDPLAELNTKQRSEERVAQKNAEDSRGFWGNVLKNSADESNRDETEDLKEKSLWR